MFLFILKRKVYDKIMPISDVIAMIDQFQIKKAIVGSVFLYCSLKSSTKNTQYVFANKLLMKEELLISKLA